MCGGRQRDGDCGGCLLELGFFYGGSQVGAVATGDCDFARRGERNGGAVRSGLAAVKSQGGRKARGQQASDLTCLFKDVTTHSSRPEYLPKF